MKSVVATRLAPAQQPVHGHAVADQQGTRERVARSILENGPSTAAVLAARLRLTAPAVRRHLDALLAAGVVEAREQPAYGARRRGRPAKVFLITDAGRDAFDQAYDDLAASALRFLADHGAREGGDDLVAAFAHRRVAELEERYRPLVDAVPPQHRAGALAQALSADGYAASAHAAPGAANGSQLCQHHCPVAHVAEQFPQLCEAETAAFARLLGTHVQRLATIARGDGVCTTHVPGSSTTLGTPSSPASPPAPHAERTPS